MSEKCGLCGGEIKRCMGEAWCANETCLFSMMSDEARMNRLQSALAFDTPANRGLVERVKKGESVEIRKRGGEWPEMIQGWINGKFGYIFRHRVGEKGTVRCETFPEAAAAWNGGEV